VGLFACGFEFTPATTVSLDTLQLPVWNYTSNNLFTLSVQQADGVLGGPGTVVESFTDLAPYIGFPPSILTVSSVLRPVLQAGESYWLVGVGEGSSLVYWQDNDQGLYGPFYCLQGGNEYLFSDQLVGAFSVSGTPVPEPAVLAFWSVILGIGVVRYGRKTADPGCFRQRRDGAPVPC
jgi:hypothetical protein